MKNKMIITLFLGVVLYLVPNKGLSQKKFMVTLSFPSELLKAKGVEIRYKNGLEEIKWNKDLHNKKIVISDSFYSKYATIIILLDSNNTCGLPHFHSFYVS